MDLGVLNPLIHRETEIFVPAGGGSARAFERIEDRVEAGSDALVDFDFRGVVPGDRSEAVAIRRPKGDQSLARVATEGEDSTFDPAS